jgi:hypothetical protein
MVLRRKTKSCCGLILLGVALASPKASAQTYTYEVRHRHLQGGAMGTLRISQDGISFDEHGKKSKPEAYRWRYEEIQQLTVGGAELRVLTYQDSKWKLGRDREYVFDRIPRNLAVEVFPMLTRSLDQRFIAAMADKRAPEWKLSAKLDHGLSGTLGTLSVTDEEIIFETKKPDESRTWRLSDIENVSSTGSLSLTLTTNEKSGLFRGGMRQFHFGLQQRLSEDRYNELWRGVNRTKGLTFLEQERQQTAFR